MDVIVSQSYLNEAVQHELLVFGSEVGCPRTKSVFGATSLIW